MPAAHAVATYAFVMFSHVLWPVFVPFSIWLLEKDPLRKKLLLAISVIGAMVSAYLFVCSVAAPVTCDVARDSIAYQIQVPYPLPSFFLYFFATQLFYPETLFSVWCFFSAVLSLIIYVHMKDLRKLVGDQKFLRP